MRAYAEQTWGSWNGKADLDPVFDEVIQLVKRDIDLLGVERRLEGWFLRKLHVLPARQKQGIGSEVLDCLIEEAKSARSPIAVYGVGGQSGAALMSDTVSF